MTPSTHVRHQTVEAFLIAFIFVFVWSRASHRYHGGHGFNSRWSLRIFSGLSLQLRRPLSFLFFIRSSHNLYDYIICTMHQWIPSHVNNSCSRELKRTALDWHYWHVKDIKKRILPPPSQNSTRSFKEVIPWFQSEVFFRREETREERERKKRREKAWLRAMRISLR